MTRSIMALTLAAALWTPLARAQDARVTVVAVLASDRHKNVDPKLVNIANEVRKQDATLTGYRIERTTSKPITLNQLESFPLVNDVNAEITMLARDDKEKKIKLKVKAPHAGEVTYTIVPEKYVPIMTRYQTANDKETLIFAVMVKPTPAKPVEKEKPKDP